MERNSQQKKGVELVSTTAWPYGTIESTKSVDKTYRTQKSKVNLCLHLEDREFECQAIVGH